MTSEKTQAPPQTVVQRARHWTGLVLIAALVFLAGTVAVLVMLMGHMP